MVAKQNFYILLIHYIFIATFKINMFSYLIG
jgi:hypothetical protein